MTEISIENDTFLEMAPTANAVSIHLNSSKCYAPSTLETVNSKVVQHFLFTLYTATAFLSLVGNIIVILVQVYGKESSKNIRKYLSNLAVADIITGVFSVPFTYTHTVFGHWVFPKWLCPTAQFVQLLSVFITSATLSIIGAERLVCKK